MLDKKIINFRKKILSIYYYLRLQELHDDALRDNEHPCHISLKGLAIGGEDPSQDKIFRHCSVINHLYSIYEAFSKDLLSVWVSLMPRYYNFEDLNSKVKSSYREGVGSIVKSINLERFKNVELVGLLDSYSKCLNGKDDWSLVPEALTLHESNLRRDQLNSLFINAGIGEIWSKIESDHYINEYKEKYSDNRVLESILYDFVEYRNESSHGTPENILGLDSLQQWVEFSKSFGEAIFKVVLGFILEKEKSIIGTRPICKVENTYPKMGNVAKVKCYDCNLFSGQFVYGFKGGRGFINRIESIEVDNQKYHKINSEEVEGYIGLNFEEPVGEKAEIFSTNIL